MTKKKIAPTSVGDKARPPSLDGLVQRLLDLEIGVTATAARKLLSELPIAEREGRVRRAEVLAQFAGTEGPSPTKAGAEGARQRKREAERERAKYRVREPRIRKSRSRTSKKTNRDLWEDYLAPSRSDYWADLTQRHAIMIIRLRDLLDEGAPLQEAWSLLGRKGVRMRARSQALKRIELAHAAAFPLDSEWQGALHHEVKLALNRRQEKRSGGPGRKSGEHVLRELRLLFPEALPAGLTGAKVEKILRTASPGPGGGPKGTKNVRKAVNELILSLGCELFELPPPPAGQTRR